MSKIKNENYLTIQGWMINELGLKGNELICFAVIYGFSQTIGQDFTGSYQYLADWCNIDRRAVIRVVNNLCAKGYVIKVIETNKKGEQNINLTVPDNVVTICHWGSDNLSPEGSDNLSSNNLDENYNDRQIDNNIELIKIFKEKEIYYQDLKYIPESSITIFDKLQQVIKSMYLSKGYNKYISSITYDDLINAYDRMSNAKNVSNDVAYMKRVLTEICRKKVTA